MGNANQASLGALRLQAQQRADMESNPFVSDPEWNQYISQSYKELLDMLVACYGNEYLLATPYQFTLNGAQSYQLPDGTDAYRNTSGQAAPKFYKLLGVDLQYSSSPNGWVSLKRFEFIERNKYAYPNVAVNYAGWTNLRYRIQGDTLFFVPVPSTGQTAQIWYIPAPTPLQYMLPVVTAASGSIASLSSTVGLTTGMNVYGDGIPTGTVLNAVASTSVTMSAAATASSPSAILSFWNDSTLMDGIAGWEEYIIVDAAIKAYIKQETDYTALQVRKTELKERIEAMAEGRDAGQAQHSSDALSTNTWSEDGMGGSWGPGSGFGGW